MVSRELKDKRNLNVANSLSLLRMILAPVFMYLVFVDQFHWAVFVIFFAILTDFLDGQIARITNMQTRLGKMLDPMADKFIIFFAIVTLMLELNFPLWVGLLIISRDLILFFGGIIFLYKNKRKTLVPNLLGKTTTFFQMATIIAFLLNIAPMIKTAFISITVILTILSCVDYFSQGYRLFFKSPRIRMNLPNQITLARIALIPLFIGFLMSSIAYKDFVAAILFILLASSDAVDGYLARKRGQVTNFGKLIDPLADKLLISSALIFLIGKGVEPWMAFIIIAREFAVTGLRTVALTKNTTLPAKLSGKIKTVAQVVAITAVILHIGFSSQLMVIAVLITLYSGIEYFWLGRHLFRDLV